MVMVMNMQPFRDILNAAVLESMWILAIQTEN